MTGEPGAAPVVTVVPDETLASRVGEVRRSARTGLAGLAGAAASGLFGFLLTVVVTRGFGVSGAGGFYALIAIVTVAAAVCCLGADTGLLWALPRRGVSVGALLGVAMLPPLVLSLAVAAAGGAGAAGLAPHLLPGDTGLPLLRWAFGAVPAAVATSLLLSAVRSLYPIGRYVAVQFLLLPAGRLLVVGAAALAGGGVVAGAAGWLLPIAVAGLAGALLVARHIPGTGTHVDGPVRGWRDFWRFAAPRSVSAAIDSASMWVGVLLTAVLAGQAEAGVFAAVGRYVLAGQLAMQGLRVAVAPQLSRLLAAGQRAEAAAVHQHTTTWVLVLSWPVYLLLAFFAPAFLRLFGGGFVAGAHALTVLALAMLVNVGLGNVQTLLLMSGRSRWHLLAVSIGLTATVGGSIVLVPRYGALGAAVCWGTGIVLENVIAAFGARRAVGAPLLGGGPARAAGLVTVTVGAACLSMLAMAGRNVTGLLGTVLVLAALAAGLLSTRRGRGLLRAEVGALRGTSSSSRPAAGERSGRGQVAAGGAETIRNRRGRS